MILSRSLPSLISRKTDKTKIFTFVIRNNCSRAIMIVTFTKTLDAEPISPTITYNYIINTQDNEYVINVSGMPQGIYKLQLVCNGQPEGEETLLLEP